MQLSFNHDSLWRAKKSFRLLSVYHDKPEITDLETILAKGELRAAEVNSRVKKSRFVLRLALSLYSLLFGPWIQQELKSSNVRIMLNGDGSWIEMLDEAYISCQVTTNCSEISSKVVPRLEVGRGEDIPKCFLSFAQLLIDIEKGENPNPPCSPVDEHKWYKELVIKVQTNKGDPDMESYWNAIEGCIGYRVNYENCEEIPINEEKDKRLRAQYVMHRYIVLPLRDNLKLLTELQKQLDKGEPRLGLELYGTKQRLMAQGQRSCSAIPLLNTQGLMSGETEEFTLWFQQDNEYTEMFKSPSLLLHRYLLITTTAKNRPRTPALLALWDV